MAGEVQEITQADFDQEVLKADQAVFVDFFAEWCGPCRMIAPTIAEIAQELDGQGVKFVKVNVDNAREVARDLGIRSIPTLIIFKNGQEQERIIGAQQKPVLLQLIEKNK